MSSGQMEMALVVASDVVINELDYLRRFNMAVSNENVSLRLQVNELQMEMDLKDRRAVKLENEIIGLVSAAQDAVWEGHDE